MADERKRRGTDQVDNPLMHKLLSYHGLRAGGCPIGRHELTDEEWQCMAVVAEEMGGMPGGGGG